jgi:hypothetical protein
MRAQLEFRVGGREGAQKSTGRLRAGPRLAGPVGSGEFVCVLREDGERVAGRSRESPTQTALRWSPTLPLPLTRTLADLRGPSKP